jgi:hypothetical protein
MTTQSWLQFVIDWFGLPALILLAATLLYRRWYREFPFFFSYVVGAELVGIARLTFIHVSPHLYFQVYWFSDTALAAFAFLAAYELFFKRLFPRFYKTTQYRLLFPAMAILITLLIPLIILIGGHSSVLIVITRVYEFLRAAILLFFIVLILVMGRLWTKQEFGIAFGFGLDVSMSLAAMGIWSRSNPSALLDRLSVIAYDIVCIVWLYCFWSADKRLSTPQLPPDALNEAKKWEGSLKDFITPGKH